MAATKALIYESFSVNGIDYSPHLQEGASVEITPVIDLVKDGQSLPSAYDVSFSVDVYDDAPLTDSNVYTNTLQAPVLASASFKGAPGSATLTITNVIVSGVRNYENTRSAIRLSGTKKAATLANAITES